MHCALFDPQGSLFRLTVSKMPYVMEITGACERADLEPPRASQPSYTPLQAGGAATETKKAFLGRKGSIEALEHGWIGRRLTCFGRAQRDRGRGRPTPSQGGLRQEFRWRPRFAGRVENLLRC